MFVALSISTSDDIFRTRYSEIVVAVRKVADSATSASRSSDLQIFVFQLYPLTTFNQTVLLLVNGKRSC